MGAAFFDYDKDGWLDLFVSNYCVWDPTTEPICNRPEAPDYCHPDGYKGLPNSLYRNNRDGTFTDVSAATGIRAHVGKGMGVGVADFDEDGWPDVFVSNDNEPAFLFHNREGRRFEEVALAAGVAYTEIGKEISGMGADARDFDNDGRPDIFQTALDGETMPLFRNRGGMAFEDWTGPAGSWPRPSRTPAGATASSTSTTTAGRTSSWPAAASSTRRATSPSALPAPALST